MHQKKETVMTKTRSLTIIIVASFLISILFSSMLSFAGEKLSFTAYYPSPTGFYHRLNSTYLSVSDTMHVGKQLNIGLINPDSNADVNIVSLNDSASLVLLGDNDDYSYATLALATPSDSMYSTDPNFWLMSHVAMPGDEHKLAHMYHGSEMDEDEFVTPLVMNPNGDIVFYGNVTIPNGRMSIGISSIRDHGLVVKRDFEDEDNAYGILARVIQQPTASGDHNIAGLKSGAIADLSSGDNTGSIQGIHSQVFLKSSGTLNEAYGAKIEVGLDADYGTIDKVYGVRIAASDISSPINGDIKTVSLLRLHSEPFITPGNLRYGIYQAGTDDKNYFAGRVGIDVFNLGTHLLTVDGGVRIYTTGNDNNFEVCDNDKGDGGCNVISYDFESGRVFLGNKNASGSEPEVIINGDLQIEEKIIGLSNSFRTVEEINDCGQCAEAFCPCDEEAKCNAEEDLINGGCEFESDNTEIKTNSPHHNGGRWLCGQKGNSQDGTALITRAYAICLQE